MPKNILTAKQKLFLQLFASSRLSANFYLTGGTALSAYYIPYRYSEDLDFFSQQEVDSRQIMVFLKSVKSSLRYQKVAINTSFNRNLFFLHFQRSVLKTEFTYFPFEPLQKPKESDGIKINSILDIAVDKLFTIYQQPRSRDFMDLYMIGQKYRFELSALIKKAKVKFDWQIDLIKLGAQFLLVEDLKDYPQLLKPLAAKDWQKYFLTEARKLKKEILI